MTECKLCHIGWADDKDGFCSLCRRLFERTKPLTAPEPVSSEIEESPQTIMGHRTWRWVPGEGLYGKVKRWKSGFMEAKCPQKHDAPHWPEVPGAFDPAMVAVYQMAGLDAGCLCGINAYKQTHLLSGGSFGWAPPGDHRFDESLPVIGVVELGGEVHEYSEGYRAQYGQIVNATIITSLPIDKSALQDLEDQYDAPFRTLTYDEWEYEWEATHGRDRKAEAEDQGPQTGATTQSAKNTSTFNAGAGAVNTFTASQAASIGKSAWSKHDKLMAVWLSSIPRSRWQQWKDSWRTDWQLSKPLALTRGFIFYLAWPVVIIAFALSLIGVIT